MSWSALLCRDGQCHRLPHQRYSRFREGRQSVHRRALCEQAAKNLFCVINRFDSLNEEEQHAFKERAPQQLREVFARNDSSFDQALFNRRVFYTNAYGSLNTRLGLPAAKIMGQAICVKDEETGVPQFEEALEEFLTSDGRDKAAFQFCMPHLASTYLAAESEIDRIMERYSADLSKLMADKEKIQANEEKAAEDLKKAMVPFTRAVNDYVSSELGKMGKMMEANVRTRLKELDDTISAQASLLDSLELPLSMTDIVDSLLTAFHVKPINTKEGVKNSTKLFQVLMGTVMLDPEAIAVGSNGAQNMLKGMRQTIINDLSSREDRFAAGLEEKMSVILRAGVTMTGDIENMLKDYARKL